VKGDRIDTQIIGCGAVGSQIAKELLEMDLFDCINLVDIDKKKVKGHCMDLRRVQVLRNYGTTITHSKKPNKNIKFNIITAGSRRNHKKYGKMVNVEVYKQNMPHVLDFMKVFSKEKTGTFIIVTHPAKQIARDLRIPYPDFLIIHAGDMIDETGISGREIQELKGHTSFGIACEIGIMVRPLKGKGIIDDWMVARYLGGRNG